MGMPDGNVDQSAQVSWLTKLVIALSYALLIGIQVYLISKTDMAYLDATSTVLLNVISTLTLGIAVFIIFTRKGVGFPSAHSIAREVGKLNLESSVADSELRGKGVADFYPSFRAVPWPELLDQSKHVDIAVFYFDSWVKANWENLVAFFARGGSVNLFLPSVDNELELTRICSLFPEYSKATIVEKIKNTSGKFTAALEASRSQSARLETKYLNRPPLYSAIRLDRELVVLSVYENYRISKIDSSALLIDTRKRTDLAEYWDKEFGGMARGN